MLSKVLDQLFSDLLSKYCIKKYVLVSRVLVAVSIHNRTHNPFPLLEDRSYLLSICHIIYYLRFCSQARLVSMFILDHYLRRAFDLTDVFISDQIRTICGLWYLLNF